MSKGGEIMKNEKVGAKEETDLWKQVCRREVRWNGEEVYIYETNNQKVIESFFLGDKSILEWMKEDLEEEFSLAIYVYPKTKRVKYYFDICYSPTSILEIDDMNFKKPRFTNYRRILRWLGQEKKVKQ